MAQPKVSPAIPTMMNSRARPIFSTAIPEEMTVKTVERKAGMKYTPDFKAGTPWTACHQIAVRRKKQSELKFRSKTRECEKPTHIVNKSQRNPTLSKVGNVCKDIVPNSEQPRRQDGVLGHFKLDKDKDGPKHASNHKARNHRRTGPSILIPSPSAGKEDTDVANQNSDDTEVVNVLELFEHGGSGSRDAEVEKDAGKRESRDGKIDPEDPAP